MKSVLITGVSSGTGLGLSEKFIHEGIQVVGTVRSQVDATKLQSRFGELFIPLIFDITKPDQVASAAETLKHQFGIEYLSAIINNAGTARMGPLLHVSTEEFKEQLELLVVGQLTVIQHFYRFLMPGDANNEVGKIINISSVSGVGTNFLFGCYASGKHALEGLTKTLRKECEIYGITVIAVAPGNIATAIWDKQTDDIAEDYRDTDYYDLLKYSLDSISANTVKNAMSVEEFCDAFYDVFTDPRPANRYTIQKSRNEKIPFSKATVRTVRS
jgi:NAD(P)-dependent dehydrogenase (short-subunit alcohol dehydrogenase family)